MLRLFSLLCNKPWSANFSSVRVHSPIRPTLKRPHRTRITFLICSDRKSFAQRYRLRIKGLKWLTGLYQILSEFGHFKATWSVMYTFKDRYQSNPTAVHPPSTRPTSPESTSDQPVYIKVSFQFIQRLNSIGNDRYSNLIILWHF